MEDVGRSVVSPLRGIFSCLNCCWQLQLWDRSPAQHLMLGVLQGAEMPHFLSSAHAALTRLSGPWEPSVGAAGAAGSSAPSARGMDEPPLELPGRSWGAWGCREVRVRVHVTHVCGQDQPVGTAQWQLFCQTGAGMSGEQD